jgi:hypothetical protein
MATRLLAIGLAFLVWGGDFFVCSAEAQDRRGGLLNRLTQRRSSVRYRCIPCRARRAYAYGTKGEPADCEGKFCITENVMDVADNEGNYLYTVYHGKHCDTGTTQYYHVDDNEMGICDCDSNCCDHSVCCPDVSRFTKTGDHIFGKGLARRGLRDFGCCYIKKVTTTVIARDVQFDTTGGNLPDAKAKILEIWVKGAEQPVFVGYEFGEVDGNTSNATKVDQPDKHCVNVKVSINGDAVVVPVLLKTRP